MCSLNWQTEFKFRPRVRLGSSKVGMLILILGGVSHCSHGGIRLLLLSLESSVTAELHPTQPGCSLKLWIHFIHRQNKKGAA